MKRRVHVIACGVLALDLKRLQSDPEIELSMDFLPGGLHRTPRKLREQLQEAIDTASRAQPLDLIAVGYGICGLGTVGIQARHVPLAIPRVQDCIALFMGSDREYREQFARSPGTYYVAAGWVDEKAQPLRDTIGGGKTAATPEGLDFEGLVAKYGSENAEAIKQFLNSWQRNYQRAAFIDTGDGGNKYADVARAMAEEFGWTYEHVQGTRDLLRKLLAAQTSDADILVVPPHHVTVHDPIERGIKAAPVWEQGHAYDETVSIVPPAAALDEAGAGAVALGLGIDAGGTYTDAVIYDFRDNRVRCKAKALTTKWDHSVGISEALGGLDAGLLREVKLAAVSTTLATNAIVEGLGQKVGLLLMPPYGRFDPANFKHDLIAVIDGKLEIDGSELAPVNREQVRAVVRGLLAKGAGAFAVAGYASHVNPSHELVVKEVIREECELHVTCGHDISEGLNYRVRAETAALNARIIPYLEALLDKVQAALVASGVEAPAMVVKSDGSLMNLATARQRPVETILSGPAASVAGAQRLSGARDGIVVDMGGTTTDSGSITGGMARVCEDGATVGGWKTHVRALDMRTLGLGGDSLIRRVDGMLAIGPRRVAPLCWLAAREPGSLRLLDWMERNLDQFCITTRGLEIMLLNPRRACRDLTAAEEKIVTVLREGPLTLQQLATRVQSLDQRFLGSDRLEADNIVQRCGLTPTDLLHVAGRLAIWDAAPSVRLCRVFAELAGMQVEALAGKLLGDVTRKLALELVKQQLAEDTGVDSLDDSDMALELVSRALEGRCGDLDIALRLKRPVIGIGAPISFFLPGAAELLGAEAIIPTDADVANAVGAVTSLVSVHKRVRLSVDETGRYRVEGLPGTPSFSDFEAAHTFAAERLREVVKEMAIAAGTSESRVEIVIHDQVSRVADGSSLFLGRTLEGRLAGRPRL